MDLFAKKGYEATSIEEITSENMNSLIGKTVNMRFSSLCERLFINSLFSYVGSNLSRIDVSSIPFSLGNKFKEILLKFAYDKKLQELISKNKPLMNSINGK